MTRTVVIGAILAGGAGSRFGGMPKGLERVGGVRVIDRVATALRSVASERDAEASSGFMPQSATLVDR
jgi:molybdopterin-guanine dinucleotide biosynthesis protein A